VFADLMHLNNKRALYFHDSAQARAINLEESALVYKCVCVCVRDSPPSSCFVQKFCVAAHIAEIKRRFCFVSEMQEEVSRSSADETEPITTPSLQLENELLSKLFFYNFWRPVFLSKTLYFLCAFNYFINIHILVRNHRVADSVWSA